MSFIQDHPIFTVYAASILWILLSAAVLHLIRAIAPGEQGRPGLLSRAPGVDLVIAWLTLGPPVAAVTTFLITHQSAAHTWLSLLVSIAGQITALYLWCWSHELANRSALRQPRIVHVLNRNLGRGPRTKESALEGPIPFSGRLRNHFALLWMLWAVPVFNVVRLAQWVVYPVLVATARLPRYEHAKWVNLSRHKIDGLVGHDLIWCLYCDWMTGTWSLGSEMLRNIESLWCPIRFASPEKCANCTSDFPDLAAWTRADQPASDAARLVAARYPAPDGSNAWLSHPVRLTINDRPAPPSSTP